MSVVDCDVPRHSALGKDLIEHADFRDAYRVPLSHSDRGVVEIFFAIFGHRPGWMNLMLIACNKAAALAGLEVPTTSEIMNMERRDRYFVGEKIGPWPLFFLSSDELVAGRDNKHMDFRLSIMKLHDDVKPNVVVSTLCMFITSSGDTTCLVSFPFTNLACAGSWRTHLLRSVSSLPQSKELLSRVHRAVSLPHEAHTRHLRRCKLANKG